MAKHLAPRALGVLDGLVSAALVSIGSVATTLFAQWYQGVLKAQQHAHVHLGAVESVVAGLPTLAVVGILVVVVFAVACLAIVAVRWLTKPRGQAESLPEVNPTIPATAVEDSLRAELDEARTQRDEARTQRDAAQLELAALKERDTMVAEPTALLKGHVERLEAIDGHYVSHWEGRDLQRKLGRVPTGSEGLHAAFARPPGPNFIAWIQVHTLGRRSKVTEWHVSLTDKDGNNVPCEVIVKEWEQPAEWPQIKFYSIPEIYSIYLQNEHLYNVLMHIRCGLTEQQVNMRSCKVRCQDDNGSEIIFAMQAPGGSNGR